MNLSQLQYFCKLAELQHYTKAAEQLYITQPTLSNSIARLEDELGVPLFEREGRNVHLTKYGKEFNRYALQALEALEEGKEVARERAGQYGGSIDIGTIYTIQDNYLPVIIKSFREEYGTGPFINIYQGLTKALVEDLENDKYDIAFCAGMAEKSDRLCFVPILYQRLVVTLHSKDPLVQKESISIADLHGRRIVTYREDTPLGQEVKKLLDPENMHPEERCDDEITLSSMVDANKEAVGLGLDTVGRALFPNLVTAAVDGVPNDFHPVYLVYKKSGYKTPAVQHFIDLAKSFKWEDHCIE